MSEIRTRVVGGGGQITVSLTLSEIRQAFDISLTRQSQNLANGAQHHWTDTHDGLWQQTKGLVGETAVSLYLDRPLYALTSTGDYSAPDVPPNVEVRTTTRSKAPMLSLLKKDDPERPYVLAVWDPDVNLTRVVLLGWQVKRAVAREAYWSDERGGHWNVPPAELRAMSELAAQHAEQSALGILDRVANYRAKAAEHERIMGAMRPQPETPAPAASTPADAPAPTEAAPPASAPGTAGGMPATSDDTSLLERDF